jgi:ubiquinone/menaquinone biosynthesis C-methylase UbiE
MNQDNTSSLDSNQLSYGWGVCLYDAADLPWQQQRLLASRLLGIREGSVVLDLGCGTGLSFARLEQTIGETGRLMGIDANAQMLARARERVQKRRWHNVTLLHARAEEVQLPPESVDALSCFYVHDVVMSQLAMEQAIAALRPGGSLVLAGPKQATRRPGQVISRLFDHAFATTVSHTPRPWSVVELLVGPLQITEALWGSTYVARGSKP